MFYDIVFPESISIKSSHFIEYNTILNKSKNGYEFRSPTYDYPMLSYNVVNDLKTKNDLEKIINFFKIVKGKLVGFKFKDWLDYEAKNQIISTTDGIKNEFQLIKTYNIENNINIRKITKPAKNTVSIFLDNENVTNNVNIDYTSGKIRFNFVPNSGKIIKSNFKFYVPVRFDTDKIEIIMKNKNLGIIKDLKIIEIIDK